MREVDRLNLELKTLNVTVRSLREVCRTLEEERDELKDKVDALKDMNQAKLDYIEDLKYTIESLENANNVLTQENFTLKYTNGKTLPEDYKKLKVENLELKGIIEELKKQNDSMSTLCKAIGENLDSYKEENYYLTCYVEELENDIKELNEENDQLQM